MKKPLISVIVPVYNVMEYLPRCVKSLQAQTYPNLEILLVDDGSEDESGKLCEEMAAEDERIRVFHKKNGGSSSARNLGISKARGEYLGFVDSDDYVDYNMYELLVEAVSSFGTRAAQVGRDETAQDGRRLPDICVPPSRTISIAPEDFLRELILHRGDCSFCTKLIRRELFLSRQFPEGMLNEDFHLLVNMLPQIGPIVSLPQQAYHVFCRMGSNTRKQSGFSRVFADNVDNADMVLDIVQREYPQLMTEALRFGLFQRLDYMLHIPVEHMTSDNTEYRAVRGYLRKNWAKGMANPFLTPKNKVYLTLLGMAPRMVRRIHKKVKGL
nr:glycosyltransferase family 2 protein [uncultured Acetatifactor sp.]